MEILSTELLSLRKILLKNINLSDFNKIRRYDGRLFVKHGKRCACKHPNMRLEDHPYIKYVKGKNMLLDTYKNVANGMGFVNEYIQNSKDKIEKIRNSIKNQNK